MSLILGVYGLECYKTQELYFELEMAKWNVGKFESKIPESVCSKPCPMGQIKNFEVFNKCCKNLQTNYIQIVKTLNFILRPILYFRNFHQNVSVTGFLFRLLVAGRVSRAARTRLSPGRISVSSALMVSVRWPEGMDAKNMEENR